MKRSNFNPKEYEKLNGVRKKIITDLTKKNILSNKKVLDIGCGTGLFSYEIAKQNTISFVHGIDIVDNYIFHASNNNKFNNAIFSTVSYDKIEGKYDVVTMFLGFTETLKYDSFKKILQQLDKVLVDNGQIILCDEFLDDYHLKKDILGLKIFQMLGYKYLSTVEFTEVINNSDFEIVSTKTYNTNTQTTNFNGSKVKIFYENKLNEFDNTKKFESKEIWRKFKSQIIEDKGFRTNNTIRIYILKKKDLKRNKIINIETNKPTLLYDLSKIQENINYYLDLKKEFNVEFLFPVKAFPNIKVLDIFKNNSFGFDVSNKNELKFLKNIDNSFIMYSDPTSELQNDNSIRINIYGKYIKSHFGDNYNNRNNFEIIHFHIAEEKTNNVIKELLNNLKNINYSNVKMLNIGGGYENLTYQQLRELIIDIKRIIPQNVKLILEPGSMWFKKTGYLIAKVKKVRNLRNIEYTYLNASKELHSKWSIPKVYFISDNIISGDMQTKTLDYVFCGSTCYEKDIFCTYKTKSQISEKSKIIFNEIEPYSFSWNSSFNGIEKAEVKFYE